MTTLHPHYIIEDLLGHGGFAKVYRATHKETHRQVALKVLRTPEDVDPEVWARFMVRFEREAAALISLSSPNIAKVYDYSVAPEQPYLALEFIQGTSLKRLLELQGKLPVPQAIEIVGQILQGLVHAHDAGLLHRDIKPANIMLEDALWQGRRVVLIDFGIVKSTIASGQDTTTGDRMLGTPRYMAPEQILGGKVDERADLYAVGLTCVEMLLGEPVVKGADAIQVVAQHLMGELDFDLTLLDLPQGLAQWLETMTAKDTADRFASAREALDALRDLHTDPTPQDPLTPQNPSAPTVPESLPAIAPLPLPRPLRWPVAIATLTLITLLGLGLWWTLWGAPEPAAPPDPVPLTAAQHAAPAPLAAELDQVPPPAVKLDQPPAPAASAPAPAGARETTPTKPRRKPQRKPPKQDVPDVPKAHEDDFKALGISP